MLNRLQFPFLDNIPIQIGWMHTALCDFDSVADTALVRKAMAIGWSPSDDHLIFDAMQTQVMLRIQPPPQNAIRQRPFPEFRIFPKILAANTGTFGTVVLLRRPLHESFVKGIEFGCGIQNKLFMILGGK